MLRNGLVHTLWKIISVIIYNVSSSVIGGSLKFSIITATLNSENTIKNTLESVISQDFPELEYIVVDGNSTDGTLDIIREYETIVSHLISEPDCGIGDAFNKGIRLAHGEFIGIVSGDDYLLPGALKEVERAAHQNPDTDVIYGNAVVIDGQNQHQFIVRPDPDFSHIWQRQPLKHAATFVRRSAYQRYGLFDLGYRCAMDYELILRFYLRGARFVYVDYPLAAFRSGGTSNRNMLKTFQEVRDISICYGRNPILAYLTYFTKLRLYILKRLFYQPAFMNLINLYRYRSNRFTEYNSQSIDKDNV